MPFKRPKPQEIDFSKKFMNELTPQTIKNLGRTMAQFENHALAAHADFQQYSMIIDAEKTPLDQHALNSLNGHREEWTQKNQWMIDLKVRLENLETRLNQKNATAKELEAARQELENVAGLKGSMSEVSIIIALILSKIQEIEKTNKNHEEAAEAQPTQ